MNQKDYYQILGVGGNASPEQIRQAYRKLAFQYHPDRNKGNPAATEKMKEINEAYATLSDARKRREYDALREQYGDLAYERFRQAHRPEDIFRGSDINQILRSLPEHLASEAPMTSSESSTALGIEAFNSVEAESSAEDSYSTTSRDRRALERRKDMLPSGPELDLPYPVFWAGLLRISCERHLEYNFRKEERTGKM